MTDITARSIRFTYTNWRGEVAERWASPLSFRWGATEWHPKPGWLMRAFDHDKGAEREFALADCQFPADTIPKTEAIAMVAAAYEAARKNVKAHSDKARQRLAASQTHTAQDVWGAIVAHLDIEYDAIRDLIPQDACAALEAERAKARAEGVREGMERAVEALAEIILMADQIGMAPATAARWAERIDETASAAIRAEVEVPHD